MANNYFSVERIIDATNRSVRLHIGLKFKEQDYNHFLLIGNTQVYLELYAAKCNHFGYTSLFDSYTTYQITSYFLALNLIIRGTSKSRTASLPMHLLSRPFLHVWIRPNLGPCGPDWIFFLGVTRPWLHLKKDEDMYYDVGQILSLSLHACDPMHVQ